MWRALLLILLFSSPLRPAAFEFTARNASYVAVFVPATFEQAVAGCASRQLGGQPSALVPTSLLAHTLAALRAEAPTILNALLGNLYLAAAITGAQEQGDWNLWTWDEYRVCRAARVPSTATAVLVTASVDRPCYWRLSYVCVEQAFVVLQGLTSSLAWYQSYLQDAAARKPITLGGSVDMRFVSSDLVVGNPSAPPTLVLADSVPPPSYVHFNNSDAFWSRGPVVSAIYRGGNNKLLALRMLRESDVDASWSMYANGFRSMDEIVGTTASNPLEGPVFEMYNVGANFSDYIVTVQGCFKPHLVERLLFVTRSGRLYQLGRGFCTHRFREDAPPGGYLAGLAGIYMNGTWWDMAAPFTTPPPLDFAFIVQLRLVWAAPLGAPAPTNTVSLAPTVDDPWIWSFVPTRPSRFCANARWLALQARLMVPSHCSGISTRTPVCPSNLCCGTEFTTTAPSRSLTCGSTPESCRDPACSPAWGLCGTTPERQFVQFVRSPPGREGSEETMIFLLRKDAAISYAAAIDTCRSSAFMGLSWSMITAKDALDWTTSLDVRQGAYQAITTYGSIWVAASGNDTAPFSNTTCVRVAYGGQPNASPSDAFAHTLIVASCSSLGVAVCKAASPSAFSPLANATGTSPRWAPGPHALSLSPRRYGGGPYGPAASCGFALGAVVSSNSTDAMALVAKPLAMIAFSMATHPYNDSDEVTMISGVRVRLGSDPVAEAGDASSYGWHTLDLAVGETITAVSGCWGGFVERLLLHTSAGRLWTPPFLASSSCSVPFMELAPAGGYLVGLQGAIGFFMEALQLVWGQPLASPNPPSPAPAAQASPVPSLLGPGPPADAYGQLPGPPPWQPSPSQRPGPSTFVSEGATSTPGGRTSSPAVGTVGIAVGVAVAVALAVAICILLVWLRRRRAARLAVPAQKVAEGDGADMMAVKQGLAVSASGVANTTGTLTTGDMPSSHESGQQLAAVITTSQPAHVSYIADVEDRLGAYMRHGASSSLTYQHTVPGTGAASAYPPPSPLVPEPPQLDIAAAISKLHAELSGRQEQLRVTAVLGKGSFGVVYLGTWRGLRVAVKTLVVHDALVGKEGRQRHRAILEAAISKSLQHPHVVSTYASELVPLTAVDAASPTASAGQAMSSEGSSVSQPPSMPDVYKLFIIQELCDVGSLAAALAAGVVGSVAAGGAAALCALTLALDIACGMSYIHSKHIVHGDLSPSNVLLSGCSRGPDGHPEPLANPASEDMALRRPLDSAWRPPVVAKVADFGLSVHMGDNQTHASNRFQGTPAYAAPEVAQRGRLSKAADVWAYGVILLELCHGADIVQIRNRAAPAHEAPPTQAPPATEFAASTPSPAPGGPAWAAPPAGCPPALVSLLATCLALDAAARPAFSEVVQRLVGLLRACHATHGEAPATASTECVTVTLCAP